MAEITITDGALAVPENPTIPFIEGDGNIEPGTPLTVTVYYSDGTEDKITANHTYNDLQIAWLKAGSALNCNTNG